MNEIVLVAKGVSYKKPSVAGKNKRERDYDGADPTYSV